MNKKGLEEIIESYSWIKVKKFDTKVRPDDEYEYIYEGLVDHHKKETEFLINKCRELAKELISYKEYYESA